MAKVMKRAAKKTAKKPVAKKAVHKTAATAGPLARVETKVDDIYATVTDLVKSVNALIDRLDADDAEYEDDKPEPANAGAPEEPPPDDDEE